MEPYLTDRRHRRTAMLLGALLLLAVLLLAGGDAIQAQDSLWNAWYWNNTELSGEPELHRLEGQPALDLGLAAPAGGIDADGFSARWTNAVQVDSAGSYTFWARVDDGLRVWVDDTLVLDDWEPQAEHTVSATTTLSEGTHVIRVEYFDARDAALLEFEWGPADAAAPGEDDGQQPPPTDEDDDFSADVVTATTTANLNIRQDPGLQGEILDTLPQGTVVGFTGFTDASGAWVQVDAEDGPTGWVSAQFLSNVPDGLQVPGEEPPADEDDDDVSSVTVENQALGDDGTVNVPRVESEVEGWLVIHADDNGAPGPVIGQAAVSAGVNENVSVEIDTEAATPTLHAMLHADTGLMGVYEFPDDDPPIVADGGVVVEAFTLTDMDDGDEDPFPADVVTATTEVNLNLRDGPGLEFTILDTLPAGSVVGFTGFTDASGAWVQVDAEDGPTGWVSAQFLSNVPDDLQVPGEEPPADEDDEDLSSVTVEDQALGDDAMVTVPRVDSTVDGWLVIHAEADGGPGPVIGHTAVNAGANENVSVAIDTDAVTPTLYAMLHEDTGETGVYEFPDADPPVRANDQVVVRPFTLTDLAGDDDDGPFPADVVTATTEVNLNVRDGPGLEFIILDTLPAGTIVGFTGFMDETGEWVQVDDGDGHIGWVAAQFLSNVPDDLQVFEGDS